MEILTLTEDLNMLKPKILEFSAKKVFRISTIVKHVGNNKMLTLISLKTHHSTLLVR